MARDEQQRENLLAEATALVERVSVRMEKEDQETVIGFRRDGAVSVFFGETPVYQFTAAGALRRAFVDDVLYKAEQGKLVALRRQRTTRAVELVRTPLDELAQSRFLEEMQRFLATLRRALLAGRFTLIGQVPPDADVATRVREWLADHQSSIRIARSPRTG